MDFGIDGMITLTHEKKNPSIPHMFSKVVFHAESKSVKKKNSGQVKFFRYPTFLVDNAEMLIKSASNYIFPHWGMVWIGFVLFFQRRHSLFKYFNFLLIVWLCDKYNSAETGNTYAYEAIHVCERILGVYCSF